MALSAVSLLCENAETPPSTPGVIDVGGSIRVAVDSPITLRQRTRMDLSINATNSMRFFMQAHDAVAVTHNEDGMHTDGDLADLRQAWAEFGTREGRGFAVRVGRQEMPFGEERLVGADSDWSNIGLTFDAVKARLQRSFGTVEAFIATPVEADWRGINRSHPHERIQGVAVTIPIRQVSIEPYYMCAHHHLTTQHQHTTGMRIASPLPYRFDGDFDVTRQHMGNHATALHSELGWRTWDGEHAPRLAAEWNYGSQTFDELYAAAYNKYGMEDPYPGQNAANIEVGIDWPVLSHVWFAAGVRRHWLARPTSEHVADQVIFAGTVRVRKDWHFAAGFGALFNETTRLDDGPPGRTSFVSVTRTF